MVVSTSFRRFILVYNIHIITFVLLLLLLCCVILLTYDVDPL
jgi:hypothetical protein